MAVGRAGDLDALADAEARMWLADPDGDRLPSGILALVRAMDSVARLLAARLPRAERVRLPDTAHLPALERPDDVAGLLRDFLARAG